MRLGTFSKNLIRAVAMAAFGVGVLAQETVYAVDAPVATPAEGVVEDVVLAEDDLLDPAMSESDVALEDGDGLVDSGDATCRPEDLAALALSAVVEPATPTTDLIDAAFVNDLKSWLNVPVVRMTLAGRNGDSLALDQAAVNDLDQQWRSETASDDQPLITAVLNSPLSTYLLRVQAGSLGLYSEIFVMDAQGLNAGQSAITSDYWQGDEAKFQKTYDAGVSATFIDEAEYHEGSDTWRAQVNLTLADASGAKIGAATVELNLTELQRRRTAGM